MPAPPMNYRKLPGIGKTLTKYVFLYLGPDHLLQVASTGFQETYKRFYFRDIQAIFIRKTRVGPIWNIIWTSWLSFFFILLLVSGADALSFLGFLAFTGLVGLGINLFLGPTVVTLIRTAVQTERLYSLSRLPKARKVLGGLTLLIKEAQASPLPRPD